MKFLHTSDWHIGKRVHGVSMLDDQRYVLEQFIEKVTCYQPDFIIISGDLYDRSIPQVEAVRLVDDILKRIVALDVFVFINAGNHDSSDRIGFLKDLLKHQKIVFSTTLDDAYRPYTLKVGNEKVNIFSVPYLEPLSVKAITEDETIKTHDDVFKHLHGIWSSALDQSQYNILIAHGYFGATSLKSESERPLSIGGTEIIDTVWLQGFDYVALGHLHRPQRVGAEHIRYSGSLLKYSLSEYNDKKGLYSVMFKDKVISVEHSLFLPKRDMRIIRGYFEDILNTTESTEDYLMIELLDNHVLYEPLKKLRGKFPNLLKLSFLNLNISREVKVIADDLKSESSLDVFHQFYTSIKGEAPDEDIANAIYENIEKVIKRRD